MKPLQAKLGRPQVAAIAGAFLALSLMAGTPASAAKAKKQSFQMPQIRLVAVSTPVPFATIRAAKVPTKLGTVSYLLGDYRKSYDVMVSLTRTGSLYWSAPEQGKTTAQDAGTIPASRLKGADNGHLCIISEKVGTKPTGVVAKGKRIVLFNRFSPEYRACLVICPNTVPLKPVRTALFIQGVEQDLSGTSQPAGATGQGCHGKPLPWQLGAKAFDSAMRAHAKLRKPIALLFANQSKECKQLDSEVLSACRVQEILSPAVKVRIDPGSGAAEKALAARFGVTVCPSFLVIPSGSDKPKWIMPEGGKAAKGSSATMPCHFHDSLDAAIKAKG